MCIYIGYEYKRCKCVEFLRSTHKLDDPCLVPCSTQQPYYKNNKRWPFTNLDGDVVQAPNRRSLLPPTPSPAILMDDGDIIYLKVLAGRCWFCHQLYEEERLPRPFTPFSVSQLRNRRRKPTHENLFKQELAQLKKSQRVERRAVFRKEERRLAIKAAWRETLRELADEHTTSCEFETTSSSGSSGSNLPDAWLRHSYSTDSDG